ncbi:MAG: hypothetical protein CMM01_11860 [Rhodopirellula sp.]|nr:hypothetical protein [Rhodopirellula sp.]
MQQEGVKAGNGFITSPRIQRYKQQITKGRNRQQVGTFFTSNRLHDATKHQLIARETAAESACLCW